MSRSDDSQAAPSASTFAAFNDSFSARGELGKIIEGDDGLPADDELGDWVPEKHECLSRYIAISHAVRAKWLGPLKGGATYVDPFCATGRGRIKGTTRWIEGGAIVAWKQSVESGSPFTSVHVGDTNDEARSAMVERLRRLDAPVVEMRGDAVAAIAAFASTVAPLSLNFIFLDPYSIRALDFRIIKALSALKYGDILVHLSKMDLQRNLDANLQEDSDFDVFAPGWRDSVDIKQGQVGLRTAILEYWRSKVAGLGTAATRDTRLIRGPGQIPLYWLLLVAKHELAMKFWKVASNPSGQGTLL